MNANQIKQVRTHIESFKKLNFASLITQSYGENIDLGGTNIQDYSVLEYIESVEKVFLTLSQADNEGWFKSLPFQYQLGTEFGNGNLHADLHALVTHIRNRHFPQSIVTLNKLILYITLNGLYVRTSNVTTPTDVQVEHKKLKVVASHIEKITTNLEQLRSDIESSRTEIDNLTVSKKKELNEIESLLEATRKYADEVSDTNIEFRELITKSTGLVKTNEEKQTELNDEAKNLKTLLDSYARELLSKKNDFTTQLELFENKQSSFQKHLDSIEAKHAKYKERSDYLDDLIGREVGASLFETFKHRKQELNKPIFWWRIAVGASAILALLWIVGLFWNTSLGELTWQSLAVNSLKTLPAFAIFYFSISQYTKERNFQEEYAFKSAVALTVNSYATQLKVEENQDKLIMESVDKIYRTPIDKKLEQNFTAKEINQQFSVVKDLVKDLKEMIKK